MTGCNQEFQMLAILSGTDQLTGAEEASLAAHAASCTHCREVISEISSLAPHLTLATHNLPKLPHGFQARFIARATQQNVPLRGPARILPPYALPLASFAVLLLCVVGWSWKTRSPIASVSLVQKVAAPESAMTATPEPSWNTPPARNRAHPVHRIKAAVPPDPRVLNSSIHFAWPQIAMHAPTGFDRQPVFSQDRHPSYATPDSLARRATLRPTMLKGDMILNRLNQAPFAIDMASLILREPPKIQLGEVAISDLTFIPNTSSHP